MTLVSFWAHFISCGEIDLFARAGGGGFDGALSIRVLSVMLPETPCSMHPSPNTLRFAALLTL